MLGYGGGYLLLAGAACGRLLGYCAGLCLQAVGGELKTAWRLSFSNEKRVRGVFIPQDALYKSTFYLISTFTYMISKFKKQVGLQGIRWGVKRRQ